MMTLRKFAMGLESIPAATAWYLADLGEALGKQDLFTHQAPQRLKALREHSLIESAVSSNRIEGVEVEQERIGTVIFGKAILRDRSEEKLRGYREALTLIHTQKENLPVSEATILQLHQLSRRKIGDAGHYKEKDSEIIETYPDGRSRIRFSTVPAAQTAGCVRELVRLWNAGLAANDVHPLILLAAFNLDFLCIHPFRDGNGRVSRLLLLLQCYHLGYEAGRYISIERLIEENKERYYQTLEESSQGWHECRHDPWPYLTYVLFILKEAYKNFEERLGRTETPRGEKTAVVLRAIRGSQGPFRVADIQAKCPGVSVDLIRRTLKKLRAQGEVECLGRGQNAHWRQLGSTH